ncbi:DUF829-domain-containing protein [Xylariaceae sp. FL0662B]|nr:DUF829-domain-containing protein [Xylariaceae sp. FL0662B]
MVAKASAFPGFSPLADRIFIRNEDSNSVRTTESSPRDDPTTVLIYGWGDGAPKHVAKYADGYHKLFPAARILVVISPTIGALQDNVEQRIKSMLPIIDTVFPTSGDGTTENVILHIMSNTGGIYAGATLCAYQQRHGADKTLPHHLCVSDSTPGSLVFSTEAWRWSRAVAMGTAKWFPWPFTVTHRLWWVVMYAVHFIEKAIGREPSGEHAMRVFLDNATASTRAPRIYMYSKEDDLIWWEDLEAQAAIAKSKGYTTELVRFEGSPHVGHMRMHPDRYWGAIEKWWKVSMASEEKSEQ